MSCKKNLKSTLISFPIIFLIPCINLFGQPVHDPSHMVKDGGRYWVYFTGNGISCLSSDTATFTTWQNEPSVFANGTWPSWINSYVPGFAGTFWAPDLIYMNGKWNLYYACSTFGSQQSAIGVVTTDSLTSPNWQDQGMVVYSNDSVNVNAIDPAIFKDDSGRVWLLYGSYWDGIVITELDSTTGKPFDRHNLYSVANGGCEAGGMLVHNGYYYLFFDRGSCCRGVQSTYHIMMGRSTSPTGPFYDMDSVNTYNNGGSVFLHSDGRFVGPGHFGYGEGKLTYHYYDGNAYGASKLKVSTIAWKNGWPVAVYNRSGGVNDGEYVIVNRNSNKALDLENGDTVNGTNVLQNKINLAESQKWMVKYAGDGYYNIFPASDSGEALEVANCSHAIGANVQIGQFDSSACQQWFLAYMGVNLYRIMAHHSLDALEINKAQTTDGANADQFYYNQGTNQNWYFKDPSTITISSSINSAGVGPERSFIYPNPSNGNFTIKLGQNSSSEQVKVEIYSMDGRLIFQSRPVSSNTVKINTALNKGVYLVKIITRNQTETQKILIE